MTNSRPFTLLAVFFGVICSYAVIHSFVFIHTRSVASDAIQGIFAGFGLAFFTVQMLAKIKVTKVNGWITMFGCGLPGNHIFSRAVCSQTFLGPVNIPQEAMYWTTSVDGARRDLSGEHNYIMHFPVGGLPPNNAFWSLTMGDAGNRFVANPIDRYSVSDRSGLVPNADGSVDIYIQNIAPTDRESNWLPAPSDKFNLWLRVYMPGATILDGKYNVPPVVEVK